MENVLFEFKFIDLKTYKKDGVEKAVIVAYCNFGFVVNLYCSKDKAIDVKTYALNNKNDITSLVSVFYNSQSQKFYYALKNA